MLDHIGHLLGLSWNNMVSATSTNTLGFLVWTLALTIVTWGATVLEKWWRYRKDDSPFQKALRESWIPGLLELGAVIVLVIVVWWIFFIPVTVWRDHETLVHQNAAQVAQIKKLTSDLD
jgi:hypothetical protein